MLKELRGNYTDGYLEKYAYMGSMFNYHKKLYEFSDYIKNTQCKKIEIEEGKVIYTIESQGLEFKMLSLPDDITSVVHTILDFGYYDKEETDLLTNLVHDNDMVLDIGANAGWFSLHWLKKYPKTRVIAFEPILENFELLYENIYLNKLVRNFTGLNCGLSNENGIATFYKDKERYGASSMVNLRGTDKYDICNCQIFKLDYLVSCGEIVLPKLDFIKCDVEGAEKFVIEGGIETIKKFRPIIYLELLRKWSAKYNYHPNEVIKLLKGIGYFCDVEEITDETKQTNFLFIPEESKQ